MNNQNYGMKTPILEKEPEFKESFLEYSFEVVADIVFGIALGVIVNVVADFVAKVFHLPRFGLLIFQLFLICVVLYIMKIDSKYLYSSWRGQTSYGIIFTSVFLASQANLVRLFSDLYVREKPGEQLLAIP